MKKIHILFTIFLVTISYSQESPKLEYETNNTGFFNLTKISYIKAYNIRTERFVEGEGNFFSEPDANSTGAWSLQTINGFFISPNFSLGLGVGLDGYNSPNINTLPVFLDIRYYLDDKVNSLFAFTDIGSAVRIGGENSNFDRGVIFNLGGGYKFPISNKLTLISEIYLAHKTISLTEEGIKTSDDVIKINGIGLSIGLIF